MQTPVSEVRNVELDRSKYDYLQDSKFLEASDTVAHTYVHYSTVVVPAALPTLIPHMISIPFDPRRGLLLTSSALLRL